MKALSKEVIHRNVKVSHQDPTELWRQEIINEIILTQERVIEIQGFTYDELEEMLSFTCTS